MPAPRSSRRDRSRTDQSICAPSRPAGSVRHGGPLGTKVNLLPTHISEIRVVDIVGLDKQADGGTHVRSTGEVGIRVLKTESEGKGNKRTRLEIIDA